MIAVGTQVRVRAASWLAVQKRLTTPQDGEVRMVTPVAILLKLARQDRQEWLPISQCKIDTLEDEFTVPHVNLTDGTLPEIPITKLQPWKHQAHSFWFAYPKKASYICLDMGEQPLDSLVLTPAGWKQMGDIHIGDKVIGSQGSPISVDNIIEYKSRPVWEVHTADGAMVRCAPTHLWTVSSGLRKNITMTTEQIDESLKNRHSTCRFNKLPRLSPIEYPEQQLPIDPYVLGFLLANGSFTKPSGRCPQFRFTTSNQHVVEEIRKRGYVVSSDSDNQHHRLIGLSPSYLLRELGLYDCRSATKFIPESYLYASVNQRLDLLRGMMDGDGTDNGRCIHYSTTSHQLATDMSVLVRSLGGHGTVHSYPRYDKENYYEWMVTIGTPVGFSAFHVSGKDKKHRSRDMRRRIVSIVKTNDMVPMRCLQVSAGDGLYITNDYILTHNCGKSKVAVDLIVNRHHKKTLIVCPKAVIAVWPREFEKHTDQPFIICACDKGSVEQKTEQAKQALAQSDATGVPVIVVINYESVWREPFGPSYGKNNKIGNLGFAMGANFDLVVCDEHHRLKSPGGTASKFMAKLGQRVPYRLALSGTPFAHSALDIYAQYRFLDPNIFGWSYNRFKLRYAVMNPYIPHKVDGFQNLDELHNKFYSIAIRYEKKDVLDLPPVIHETRYCQLETTARKLYNELNTNLIAGVEGGIITAANALSKLLRLQQITGGHLPIEITSNNDDDGTTEMREVSTAKRDLLEDALDDIALDEPVVVFARFHADLDVIAAVAKKLGRAHCELSGRKHQYEDWREGKYNLIAVQVASGSVGIDLTRAAYCLYYSLGFSLGDFDQSLARTDRPGQTRSVTYIHLLCEKTVDEKVYASLREHRDVINSIINDIKGGTT